MYKYNPTDFPYPIDESIRKVYQFHDAGDKVQLSYAVDDLYYDLKDLQTYKQMAPEKVHKLQNYFRGLLYD